MRGVQIAALTASLIAAGPTPVAQQQKLPGPLPPDIVAAWEKTGARVAWMHVKNGKPAIRYGGEGKEGEMPVFDFRGMQPLQPGVLGRLPQPKRGFGLSFNSGGVTDAGLKELAKLNSLQSLDLSDTQVTDAGLKELAGLKSLQTLYLGGTKVTTAGAGELQKALPGTNIIR